VEAILTRRRFLAGTAAVAAPLVLGVQSRAAAATLPPALFVSAHPDDETLAMGVTIAEHVAAGQDVHLLWLTRGETSGARGSINGTGTNGWWGVEHDPAAEGYEPLTVAAFGRARIDEATIAVRCLAAGLSGTLTLHEARLISGSVTQAQAEDAIVTVADMIAPDAAVRVKTHSHIVEDHPDHLAAGHAARHLKATNSTRFGDLRHYILPTYWTDERLSKVSESWDKPASTDISHRARNACRAYAAWHPPASYAIGWHSVASMFTKVGTAPKCLYHP
jgi:LmbE family N-acetylglucosaminyl deacetylase